MIAVDSAFSAIAVVVEGVPQGPHIGPIML